MPFGWDETEFVLLVRDVGRNLAKIVDLTGPLGNLDIQLQPGVTVVGIVRNHRGEPLPSARVQVRLSGTRWYAALDPAETVESGPDGVFEAKTIPADRRYAIVAAADGWGKQEVSADTSDLRGGRCEAGPFRLRPADLAIAGVVVDPNGKPVVAAIVHAYGPEQPDLLGTQTDSEGRFVITGVCEGPIRLGAMIQDRSALNGYAETEGGATDVRIVVSEQPVEAPYVPRKPVLMKGMPLPKLAGLGLRLPADAEGKMVLLCFWDLGQRPSRNCVIQLAARASELAGKGLVIVAVQTAGVEGDAADRWIQDHRIPFQVGRIAEDGDRTQFTWGAVSLPHLILTDERHVVVAEGFSPADLDKYIEAAAGR